MMFDTVFHWLFGYSPEGLEYVEYIFRCLFALILFDFLIDMFNFARHLVMNDFGRR